MRMSTTSNMLDSSKISNNQNKIQVAIEFYQELNSILNSKPPVSKDKVNKIVREALKSHRYYKHVVYYVENFIKNCPTDYKLSGLYVIDALIRKQNTNSNSIEKKKHQAYVDSYTKRFSMNICKTFTNLFLKSPQPDRVKINRVIELWQKYNVIDNDLIDKLNRISNTSKIDIALSEKSINSSDDKISSENLLNELDKLNHSIPINDGTEKKSKSSSQNKIITKTEISKILEFDKDFDSDSDNQSSLKRKSISPTNPTSIYQSTTERLQNSISNCTAWLQTNPAKPMSFENQNINLADFVPPDYMKNFSFVNSPNLFQPPPPPAPVPPPPVEKKPNETKTSPKEREKERQRRGLPILKDKHLCICSKTIWLGHLSKSTNENNVIDEIIDLLSPSSSSHDSEFNSNKKRTSRSNNGQTIVADVHLIPPRGCAYVEFFDRKTASKCLDKMRDNYRLDGNYVKVAWATNKGIEKEKRLREFWNVDLGCTYIPWQYLESISKETIDLNKWAVGGIVDEDSLSDKYLKVYRNQMLQMANSDSSVTTKTSDEESKNQSKDMDICTDENQKLKPNKQSEFIPKSIAPIHYQNLLNSQQVSLPINFSTPPSNLAQLGVSQSNQFLNSNSTLAQNQIGLSSIQVHPINFQAMSQFNPVFPANDSNQETLVPPNQNLIDLLNSQRNLFPLPNFPPTSSQFQFFHRPIMVNPPSQNQMPLAKQTNTHMRKILLPFHSMQGQLDLKNNESSTNNDPTSEISSTTQNEEKIEKSFENNNGNYRKNNWRNSQNYNKRRSYGNDYNRNSYINNNRFSNQSNSFRNQKFNNGQNLDRK